MSRHCQLVELFPKYKTCQWLHKLIERIHVTPITTFGTKIVKNSNCKKDFERSREQGILQEKNPLEQNQIHFLTNQRRSNRASNGRTLIIDRCKTFLDINDMKTILITIFDGQPLFLDHLQSTCHDTRLRQAPGGG